MIYVVTRVKYINGPKSHSFREPSVKNAGKVERLALSFLCRKYLNLIKGTYV